jgi:hypothetical protein
MRAAAQRAPIRCWFSAVSIAMHSAELGVHHTAVRCAMGAGGFVRARLWGHATKLDPCRAPVALIFDNQLPYAPCAFENDHHTGFLRWVGLRQEHVYKSQPMAAAALARTTQVREQARPTTDAGIAGLSLDLTVDIRVGIRSAYLTVEVLTRSAHRQDGPRMRGISEVAVLRRWYRRWFAPDSN